MLAASAGMASAWQAHAALRAAPTHVSRARPILARDDDLDFSRRKIEAALAEARYGVIQQLEDQADQKNSGSCASMPSLMKQSIVGYQLAWTLGALLLVAEVSAHLAHVPPPVVSLLDPQLALNGVLVGIPSAVVVSRLERWRSDASSPASPSGSSGPAAPADRRQSQSPAGLTYVPARLTQYATPTLQLVFLPVRPFFPLFAEVSGKQVAAPSPAMAAYTYYDSTSCASTHHAMSPACHDLPWLPPSPWCSPPPSLSLRPLVITPGHRAAALHVRSLPGGRHPSGQRVDTRSAAGGLGGTPRRCGAEAGQAVGPRGKAGGQRDEP